MPAKRAKEIALAFPRGAHQEVFITGVLRYSIEHGCNWSYVTSPESLAMSVLDLRGWRGDGIIAALNTPSEAACVKQLECPDRQHLGHAPQDARAAREPRQRHGRPAGGRAFDRARLRNVRLLRPARRRVFGGSPARIRRTA